MLQDRRVYGRSRIANDLHVPRELRLHSPSGEHPGNEHERAGQDRDEHHHAVGD
jgi:hypothetical protein